MKDSSTLSVKHQSGVGINLAPLQRATSASQDMDNDSRNCPNEQLNQPLSALVFTVCMMKFLF